jgi:small subunit ribosomal protein S12
MATIQQLIKGARQTKKFRSSTPAFRNAPQKKGTVLRLDIIKPKKPNSAKRKVAKVRLRNGREIMAYIPGIGHNVQKHSDLLIRGGRVPDLPGVRYHCFRQKCDFSAPESFPRKNKRSKYGVKLLKIFKDEDVQ